MTSQCWEIITIDGARLGMLTLPLDAWLATRSPPIDMEKLSPWVNSACWRGYIGLWRLEDGRLWLDGITCDTLGSDDCPDSPPEIDMRPIFDGDPGPIECTWFTGKLRVPLEPELAHVHMGWMSTYRYERIIHIRQGKVVRERHVDHTDRFLATYANLRWLLVETSHPDHQIGLQGLTWLTDDGYALVAEHLGLPRIRPDEPGPDL